jgi:hypothetical protein
VGVDHGRFYVFVAEQLLYGSDVITGFQQVGGKAIPQGGFALAEGMWADRLGDACQAGRLLNRLLEAALMHVMATCNPAAGVSS